MENIISAEQCRKILFKVNPNYVMTMYSVKPLGESFDGITAQHLILRIFYKHEEKSKKLQLFIKTLDKTSSVMYNISVNLLMFEKERLFYMKLLPFYEERGIDVSFAPRGYLCENETVVMEDLSLQGFKLSPKNKPLDLEHFQHCLAVIAKLHASTILYEVCRSKSSGAPYNLLTEYYEFMEDLVFCAVDNDGEKYYKQAVEALIAVAEFEFGLEVDLNYFKNRLMSNVPMKIDNESEMRCTLLHGDLWTNNFLHLYQDDGKHIETKLIDFQLIKYGPPALDILQFLFMNTTKGFRQENQQYLLGYYYQVLNEIMQDRGLDVGDYLPKEKFFESCEKLKLLAKIQATVDRSLMCLPDEFLYVTIPDDEKCYDFAFVNRKSYVLDIYKNNSEYRNIISEDLRELKEMIDFS